MLAYANTQKVPVWTELKLLDFIKMKDQASFTGIHWKKDQLSFNLNSSLSHSNGLTFMVPIHHGDKKIVGITINSKDQSNITRRVKGTEFALSTVQPGETYSVVVKYGK
jgi:hypothetical protein